MRAKTPEATREKRQEFARLRHEVNHNKVGERGHRYKAANR